MKAYLDMSLRDEAFVSTMNEIKPKELYTLKEILQPIQIKQLLVKPMDKFTAVLNNTLECINGVKYSTCEAVSKLLKNLE